MNRLQVAFSAVPFKNPFILPSGIYSDAAAYVRAFESGIAGITWKSLTFHAREGNPLPRVWKNEHNVINSVGLRNPGIDKGVREIQEFQTTHPKIPVIGSIFSTNVKEFVFLAEKMVQVKPAFIELNLSCPNVEDDLGKPFGMQKEAAGTVVNAVKKVTGSIPLLAKLTPNVPDIADIAKSCEAEGADGIVAINTVGPGMMIDIVKRKPILGAKRGGVSGPGMLPIAVRCVYDIYEAVKIPIIGMGGIVKWQDIVEMMLAGATMVGIGSAMYYGGMKVIGALSSSLNDYLEKNHLSSVTELTGAAHGSKNV